MDYYTPPVQSPKTCAQLEEVINRLEKRLAAIELQLAEQEESRSTENLSDLELTKSKLQMELKVLKMSKTEMPRKKLEVENEELKTKVAELEQKLAISEEKQKNTDLELANFKENAMEVEAALKEQIKTFEKKKSSQFAKMVKMKQQNDKLKKSVGFKDDCLKYLELRCNALVEKKEQAEGRVEELENELVDMSRRKEELDRRERELERKEEKYEQMKIISMEQSMKCEGFEIWNEKLRKEVAEMRLRLEKLVKDESRSDAPCELVEQEGSQEDDSNLNNSSYYL